MFLRSCVPSPVHMDILLTLASDDTRWWSAEQAAEALGRSPAVVSEALELLAGRNLLDVKIGTALSYRFSPLHDTARRAVEELAARPGPAREAVEREWL
jgi:hypothetical protein